MTKWDLKFSDELRLFLYDFISEPKECLYVCRLSRGGVADDDFAQHVRELKKAVRESAAKGVRLSAVVLMTSGHPVPSAKWRAEAAKMMTANGFDPYIAVISSNPTMRGVLTAISWSTQKYAIEFKMFSELEEGLLWLEERRKNPLPKLKTMIEELENSRLKQKGA